MTLSWPPHLFISAVLVSDSHSSPDSRIDLVVSLGTGDSKVHTESRQRDQQFITDIVGISNPCDFFAFEGGRHIDILVQEAGDVKGDTVILRLLSDRIWDGVWHIVLEESQKVGQNLCRVIQIAKSVDDWYWGVFGKFLSRQPGPVPKGRRADLNVLMSGDTGHESVCHTSDYLCSILHRLIDAKLNIVLAQE